MLKKVTVIISHCCLACGGEIKPGEVAWVHIKYYEFGAKLKYPKRYYYHYKGDINPLKVSLNEYRKQVCSKL
jgi:hypothetical protein